MATQISFLTLPRELRDILYQEYFTSEGGYHFDFKASKFRTLHEEPISLSLRLTCRTIAIETRGLAFRYNSLNFSTASDDTDRETFGHFNVLLPILIQSKANLLTHAAEKKCLSKQLYSELANEYPQLQRFIREMEAAAHRVTLDYETWGDVPSAGRHFTTSALNRLADTPQITHALAKSRVCRNRIDECRRTMALWYDPWTVPTTSHINEIMRAVPAQPLHATLSKPHFYWDKLNYRLSAAAIAVQVLQSLPPSTRSQLRHIVLHEDHVAIAWPECHAQGLIPFCRESPHLRIERRVSLWRAVLAAGPEPLFNLEERIRHMPTYNWDHDAVRSHHVTKCVASWIVEARALKDQGMPSNAFKLALEADGIPERSSEVFDVVKQDAAWHDAYVRFCASQAPASNPWNWWSEERSIPTYVVQGFPDALRDIVAGTSVVSCDFDVGGACDVDVSALVERARNTGWTLNDWTDSFFNRHGRNVFETQPPLPSWLEIRREEYVSTMQQDQRGVHRL